MNTSEEIDTIFEEVEQLLTDEACSDDEGEKRRFIDQGLAKAARLLELAPDYCNTYHLHGLLWYHHPDKSRERSRNIKEFLKRAVGINPRESHFSIQYLGYIYFDEDNFSEALKWFEKTDENYFEEDDKRWRWLKARELALICRGEIGSEVGLEAAKSLAAEYVRADREDQNPALPTEISDFTRSALKNGFKNSEALARIVVAMLEKLDMAFLINRYQLPQAAERDDGDQTPTAVDQKSHGHANTNL